MDKEKMNNDPQNTSEEITERIEEMIEEETETGAGTVSISDRLREAEADENDYDADVEDGYDEAEYDEADGEVDGENEYGEASEDAEYVEDEYSEEEEDDDDEPRIVVNPKVVKVASLILFSGIILVFASIAWFTMNRDVSSGGMSVSTKAITFNIKSKGAIPYNAPFEAATEYKTGIADANNEYYLTGTNNDNVQWRMDGIATEQLQPGAYGKLTFWVVPKDNQTTLDMEFSVSMRGYALSNETWTEITDMTALGYLNSHVLFFRERYPTTYANEETTDFTYKGLITEPYQVSGLSESDAVTIYWIWPETFSQMIAEPSVTADNRVAYDAAALTEIKNYVIAKKTNMFPAGTEDLTANVNACCDASSTATASEITAAISILDSGYNTGDSVIGSQIRGALTALKAEAIAEHASP